MPMAARKEQPQQRQAEVIPISHSMPRLSRRLESIIAQGSENVTPDQLRQSIIALDASLPRGSMALLRDVIKRSGKGWGVPNACLICDEPPPLGMHEGYKRRRWQSLHHFKHALKGETRENFFLEVHEGDVGPKK